jgi:hypothetical protein
VKVLPTVTSMLVIGTTPCLKVREIGKITGAARVSAG